ncbi:hypothetical protein L0Y40_01295 [Candidatus Wolfebacteria bacterium]|nr:hypothetical protein [Candidatus Wolfebacteria bacterium]
MLKKMGGVLYVLGWILLVGVFLATIAVSVFFSVLSAAVNASCGGSCKEQAIREQMLREYHE